MSSPSQVTLVGQLSIGGADCCDPCAPGPGNLKLQALGLRCTGQWFAAVVSTDLAVTIATAGVVGAAWVELPVTDALDAIELLMVRTSAPMRLRIGAAPAALEGVGGVFPTGFVGAETLIFSIDGDAVTATFLVGDQTAAQVVARINAAAALAGFTVLPASVAGSGQVELQGVETGVQGSVLVTGGTAQAALGFAPANDEAAGEGSDVDVYGLFLMEAGRGQPTAPERVQISGSGTVEVFAAGTSL